MLKRYLDSLQKTINQGDATEESHYKHLDNLIREFAVTRNIQKVNVTILPKKTEAGNPDFRVWDGKNHITGYVEAKAPSITNLDAIQETEQLKRYRSTFPNVILTNFYEFRLYRDGELIKATSIARPVIAQKLSVTPPLENEDEFIDLFNTFFSFSLPQVRSAKTLALELAKRTKFLRDEVVSIELAIEEKNGKRAVLGFYEAFKKYLIGTLTEQSFADLYSQTITYGLFAARTRADNSFNRELAFKYIPNTIGILRDVFRFISLEEPPKPLEVIVDDIAEVLNVADVNKILHDYYRDGKGQDPIVHFYETFLAEYDPAIRERRGVYYTPEPVVGYIVRSIHQILKTHFNLADGLASSQVTLLDPAGGTLTFPAEALKTAVKEYTDKYGEGGKTKLIRNQILPNFYAFELMMAPYAIGHLKMGFMFEELGYHLKDDERFNLYLTNTLEMEDLAQVNIPGLSSLSEESTLAGKVKKDQQILVICGNPPYSGISANINEWTERLLKQNVDGATSYYEVDGKPLGEKKVWLQDDYVKFLRFAQWKIQKAGFGIVGMITNHSYLDNPTFRGMRQSLMKTFNEIYILDLHGNSLKKETTPDGGKDGNVFDIRQGVAIALFVKQKAKKECKVFHSDLYGLREVKYDWLENKNFSRKNYQAIQPESPWYFFVPRDTAKIKKYLTWKSIIDVFPINNVGIVTARDHFAISYELSILRNRINQFRDLKVDDKLISQAYKLKDTSTFKFSKFREECAKEDDWENNFRLISYRPFDIRHTYYSKWVIERPIYDTMRHMLKDNICLSVVRQVKTGETWQHCLISNTILESCYISNKTSEIGYAFPLYIYKDKIQKKSPFHTLMLFEPEAEYGGKDKIPNIDKTVYEKLNNTYKKKLTPEEILYYIYAVFYSNIYREKYAEFLKIDFPRVPFTADYKVFKKMAEFGQQLADVHLMKSDSLDKPMAKYQGKGDNDRIEKVAYVEKDSRVYINKEKHFDNVSPELWNYQIGGYQVLQKYLKDRKGRHMDNPRHYCRIVTAIDKTITLQNKIDVIFNNLEKKLIEFPEPKSL
jgi:predicted helicase